MATQGLPAFMIPFVIYGGLPANLNDLPVYTSWIQYLNPIRHLYSSLLENVLNTDKMHNLGDDKIVR